MAQLHPRQPVPSPRIFIFNGRIRYEKSCWALLTRWFRLVLRSNLILKQVLIIDPYIVIAFFIVSAISVKKVFLRQDGE